MQAFCDAFINLNFNSNGCDSVATQLNSEVEPKDPNYPTISLSPFVPYLYVDFEGSKELVLIL